VPVSPVLKKSTESLEAKHMSKNDTPIEYSWRGINTATGQPTKGTLSSQNITTAQTEIRRQGIRIIRIKPKSKSLLSPRQKKITSKDIAILSRQLSTMLEAGVPLVQAFEITGQGHDNESMKTLLLDIKKDIENGLSFTEALKKRPDYFDDLFCSLVQAGEQAGVLEILLDKIATYKEKTESLKAKIKKALTYPIAVLIVAVLVTAILLLFVVPVFEELFQDFGADLPLFTRLVIDLSEWLQAFWWVVLGVLAAIIMIVRFFHKRSPIFRHTLDKIYLIVPVIGPILRKAAIARFARTLSTLSTAGVPLVDALTSVSGATGNHVYSQQVLAIRDKVSTGQQLQLSMQQTEVFPFLIIQMVAIGEESGSMDKMLSKIADFYEEDIDNAVDNLSDLLEPLIMVILGGLVGSLVVAMYLPIFKLGSVI